MNKKTLNPPQFIRTPAQLEYYDSILADLVNANMPLEVPDRFAIGSLALAFSIVDSCMQSIEEHGAVIATQNEKYNTTKANPCLKQMDNANIQIRALMAQLKMSPQSRGKLQLLNAGLSDDDGWDQVF